MIVLSETGHLLMLRQLAYQMTTVTKIICLYAFILSCQNTTKHISMKVTEVHTRT